MTPRVRRAMLWVMWLGIVVAACAGLSRYRIDNDLRRWMPDLAGLDALSSVVIVGYDRDTVDGNEIAGLIGAGERVAFVWPIVGDGQMDGLLVTPKPGVASASLLDDVRTSLTSQPGRFVLAGPAVFSEAINEWSQRGLPLATGLILAIGAVTLYLTTRRVRPAAEGLTAVFSSQLVLVGAIAWTGRAMDMMLSMTPPLMMALGYSFAAHRALRRGANRALLLSMVTTCLSLLSFTLTDFAPIRSFAWYGAAGVVVTWAAVMLLVTPPDSAVSDCPIHAIPVPPRNNRAWAMMLTGTGLAVTLAGIWLAGLIHVEQDVLRAFPPDAGIARDYRLLNDELTGMLPFEVRVVGDADPSPMLRDTPGVRRVVPLPKTLTAPRTGRWYLGFADNDALPGLVASQRDWQAWAKSNHVELEWAGVAAQIDHIGRSVMRAARRGVPMMALIAGLAAWMIDRRWSTALLSIYVNLFPLSMLIIGVVVMRHPVGLPTLVIASLAIGIAIDDTLHLLCVRRAYGSMSAAVRACRRPCLGSSLAVALCTAMLGLCAFHPTAEFGLIVSAVVLVAALGDLVLLPAAVVALGKD